MLLACMIWNSQGNEEVLKQNCFQIITFPQYVTNISLAEICGAGSFYNATANKCDMCSPGYYQNKTGQMQCDFCPSGKTSARGAKSLSDCFGRFIKHSLSPGSLSLSCRHAAISDRLNLKCVLCRKYYCGYLKNDTKARLFCQFNHCSIYPHFLHLPSFI